MIKRKDKLKTTKGFYFGTNCDNKIETLSKGNSSSIYIPINSIFYHSVIEGENVWIYDIMKDNKRTGSCMIYEKYFKDYKNFFK